VKRQDWVSHCEQCSVTWPCDTVAALDALEEERNKYAMNLGFAEDEIAELRYRLDIATELIQQAMRARHAIISVGSGDRACGAPPSATRIDTCENCRPYREWLGGEGQ
jgi:hypothetical protein